MVGARERGKGGGNMAGNNNNKKKRGKANWMILNSNWW